MVSSAMDEAIRERTLDNAQPHRGMVRTKGREVIFGDLPPVARDLVVQSSLPV